MTGVRHAFPEPWPWPLVQEHNLGTIDDVGLDPWQVQELVDLRHSDHIMVGWSPYLDFSQTKELNGWNYENIRSSPCN